MTVDLLVLEKIASLLFYSDYGKKVLKNKNQTLYKKSGDMFIDTYFLTVFQDLLNQIICNMCKSKFHYKMYFN